MRIFVCDNILCRRVIDRDNSATISIKNSAAGNIKHIHLCDRCYNQLLAKSGMQLSETIISVEDSKIVEKVSNRNSIGTEMEDKEVYIPDFSREVNPSKAKLIDEYHNEIKKTTHDSRNKNVKEEKEEKDNVTTVEKGESCDMVESGVIDTVVADVKKSARRGTSRRVNAKVGRNDVEHEPLIKKVREVAAEIKEEAEFDEELKRCEKEDAIVNGKEAYSRIDEYGEDRVRMAYSIENKTLQDLAKEIGVDPMSMLGYLRSRNIKHIGVNANSAIRQYGIDRAIYEYTIKKETIGEIAKRVGVKEGSLRKFFVDNNIKKTDVSLGVYCQKKTEKNNNEVDSINEDTENEVEEKQKSCKGMPDDLKKKLLRDIYSARSDSKLRIYLKSNERLTTNIPEACRNCAYRSKEHSDCWYTLITDKKSNATRQECAHYVPVDGEEDVK